MLLHLEFVYEELSVSYFCIIVGWWTAVSPPCVKALGSMLQLQLCQNIGWSAAASQQCHDDIIKWKHFSHCWPFVQGIHRSPVNSPHKGQWCKALMFSLICASISGWVKNEEAGDLRRNHNHYVVMVMVSMHWMAICTIYCMCPGNGVHLISSC